MCAWNKFGSETTTLCFDGSLKREKKKKKHLESPYMQRHEILQINQWHRRLSLNSFLWVEESGDGYPQLRPLPCDGKQESRTEPQAFTNYTKRKLFCHDSEVHVEDLRLLRVTWKHRMPGFEICWLLDGITYKANILPWLFPSSLLWTGISKEKNAK